MSTRNIAIEFLEKELAGHKQQLSEQHQEFDTRLKPLRAEKRDVYNEIESARSLIEGLEAKLKDFDVLDKRLDEHIKKEEKKFETEMASLNSRITGLNAAVTELRKVAGMVTVKKEQGTIEIYSDESHDMEGAIGEDADGGADTSMSEAVNAGSEVAATNADRVDVETATVSLHLTKESKDTAPSENTESSKTTNAKDVAPGAQCTPMTRLSSSDHAAEILSRILPQKLPSFEKRKTVDGPTQPPVERLKKRKPSFAEEVSVFIKPRKKPGPKPKKKPDPEPKGQAREPLTELAYSDPNTYIKQFGRRRKAIDEDSDGSWEGSDDDELEIPFNSEEVDTGVHTKGRRRGRRSRKPDGNVDVASELMGELTELVEGVDGSSGRRGKGVEPNEVLKSDKNLATDGASQTDVDSSIEALFFEKPGAEDVAGGKVVPSDGSLSTSRAGALAGPEVKPVIKNDPGTNFEPTLETATHTEIAIVPEVPVAVKAEAVKSCFALPPLSASSLCPPHPKLPGPQELGLVAIENTTGSLKDGMVSSGEKQSDLRFSSEAPPVRTSLESHATAKAIPPLLAIGIPTGPSGLGSTSGIDLASSSKDPPRNYQDHTDGKFIIGSAGRHGDGTEAQQDSHDRNDFRFRELTWNQLRNRPKMWAHLHSIKQLKGLCYVQGRYTSVRCLHVYPGVPCSQSFETLRDLRIHMYNDHGIKTYACLLCKAAFARKNDLWEHCKQDHDGQMGKYWRGHSDHV